MFLVKNGGSMISAGQKTTIVVTPRTLMSTDEVESVPQKERNCLFENEALESEIFSVYRFVEHFKLE